MGALETSEREVGNRLRKESISADLLDMDRPVFGRRQQDMPEDDDKASMIGFCKRGKIGLQVIIELGSFVLLLYFVMSSYP